MKIKHVKNKVSDIERDIMIAGAPHADDKEIAEKLSGTNMDDWTIEIDDHVRAQMEKLGITPEMIVQGFEKYGKQEHTAK
jgi:hypothetical protein